MVLDGCSHGLQMEPRFVGIGTDQVAVDREGLQSDEGLERIGHQRKTFALQRRVIEVEFREHKAAYRNPARVRPAVCFAWGFS